MRHEDIIPYDYYSQQLLLEKSKKYRRPTVSNPENTKAFLSEFDRNPSSPAHGVRIIQPRQTIRHQE
jgi:hypothetical protein